MTRYSQNDEQRVILEYFGERVGTFLDIGSNDGETFSNTRALAQQGWAGYCIDASLGAYRKCSDLYSHNPDVRCFNLAVGTKEASGDVVTFYEGRDSLLSTLDKERTKHWEKQGLTFHETHALVVSFEDLLKDCPPPFEMISIDAEGADWDILQQIDLDKVGCQLLVIEYGKHLGAILMHCKGFRVLMTNGENVIVAR